MALTSTAGCLSSLDKNWFNRARTQLLWVAGFSISQNRPPLILQIPDTSLFSNYCISYQYNCKRLNRLALGQRGMKWGRRSLKTLLGHWNGLAELKIHEGSGINESTIMAAFVFLQPALGKVFKSSYRWYQYESLGSSPTCIPVRELQFNLLLPRIKESNFCNYHIKQQDSCEGPSVSFRNQ